MSHSAQDYGIHESNLLRTIQKIKDILIMSRKFSLPRKKRLFEKNELSYTTVDVTEMSVERPKKNKEDIIPEKRSGTA